jgi:hypothetical protein
MRKQMEGDNKQRRQAAKDARDEGRSPSEAGVTTGASKQQRHVDSGAAHDERTKHLGEGKQSSTRREPDLRPESGRSDQSPR